MSDADLLFSRRLSVVVRPTTFRMRVARFVISYPGLSVAFAVIVLLAIALRAPGLLVALVFPGWRLLWATNRDGVAARKLGIATKVVTAKIPKVAIVSVSDGGLSIEGMNVTLSRQALLRTYVDATGLEVVVETKRDLPNFTFVVDDPADGRALVAALVDPEPLRTNVDLPTQLQRGELATSQWIEVLRAGGAAGYRAAVPADDLWRVLASADAPLAARAGAAIALAPRLDKKGRRRFKEIKSDSPRPLRAVLKAAGGADSGELIKAMDACLAADA